MTSVCLQCFAVANKQNLELAASGQHLRGGFKAQKGASMMSERMSTDIAALKHQYMTIRSRQLKAHLVYAKPGLFGYASALQ